MTLSHADRHEGFTKRLDASRSSTFRVAEWLHKKGFSVTIPAIRFAPLGANPLDYVDEGDLFIESGGKKHRIDVKHRGTEFTDADSWPQKLKGKMIVSNKIAVDRANGESKAYIIVSQPMTHIAIIWNTTREHWVAEELFSRNIQQLEWFYLCPIEHVDFRDLKL
jgi:hypothetical protein